MMLFVGMFFVLVLVIVIMIMVMLMSMRMSVLVLFMMMVVPVIMLVNLMFVRMFMHVFIFFNTMDCYMCVCAFDAALDALFEFICDIRNANGIKLFLTGFNIARKLG
jgi:hypothetical protein